MASDTERILVDIAVSGQGDVIDALGEIGKAGEEAFKRLGDALGVGGELFAGLVTGLAGVGAALFEWSKHSSEAVHSQELLATQTGTTVLEMSAMQGALASMGGNVDNLGMAFRRLSNTVAREWEQITKEVKTGSDQVINDQLSVEKAALSAAKAQDALAEAYGGKKDLAHEQLIKRTEATLGLAEAQQKLIEAQKKQVDDQRNSIPVVAAAVDSIVKGQDDIASAGQKADLTVQNVIKGLVASASQESLDAIKNFSGSISGLVALTPKAKDVFYNLADFMHNAHDATLEQAVAMRFFGRGVGENLIFPLRQGSDALREHEEKLKRVGLVITDEMVKPAEEFHHAYASLSYDLSTVVKQIGLVFAPDFTKGLKDFTSFFEDNHEAIVKWADELEKKARPVIEGFADAITGAFASLTGAKVDPTTDVGKWKQTFDDFGNGVNRVVHDVMAAFSVLKDGVTSVRDTINETLGTKLTSGETLLGGVALWTALGGGIAKALGAGILGAIGWGAVGKGIGDFIGEPITKAIIAAIAAGITKSPLGKFILGATAAAELVFGQDKAGAAVTQTFGNLGAVREGVEAKRGTVSDETYVKTIKTLDSLTEQWKEINLTHKPGNEIDPRLGGLNQQIEAVAHEFSIPLTDAIDKSTKAQEKETKKEEKQEFITGQSVPSAESAAAPTAKEKVDAAGRPLSHIEVLRPGLGVSPPQFQGYDVLKSGEPASTSGTTGPRSEVPLGTQVAQEHAQDKTLGALDRIAKNTQDTVALLSEKEAKPAEAAKAETKEEPKTEEPSPVGTASGILGAIGDAIVTSASAAEAGGPLLKEPIAAAPQAAPVALAAPSGTPGAPVAAAAPRTAPAPVATPAAKTVEPAKAAETKPAEKPAKTAPAEEPGSSVTVLATPPGGLEGVKPVGEPFKFPTVEKAGVVTVNRPNVGELPGLVSQEYKVPTSEAPKPKIVTASGFTAVWPPPEAPLGGPVSLGQLPNAPEITGIRREPEWRTFIEDMQKRGTQPPALPPFASTATAQAEYRKVRDDLLKESAKQFQDYLQKGGAKTQGPYTGEKYGIAEGSGGTPANPAYSAALAKYYGGMDAGGIENLRRSRRDLDSNALFGQPRGSVDAYNERIDRQGYISAKDARANRENDRDVRRMLEKKEEEASRAREAADKASAAHGTATAESQSLPGTFGVRTDLEAKHQLEFPFPFGSPEAVVRPGIGIAPPQIQAQPQPESRERIGFLGPSPQADFETLLTPYISPLKLFAGSNAGAVNAVTQPPQPYDFGSYIGGPGGAASPTSEAGPIGTAVSNFSQQIAETFNSAAETANRFLEKPVSQLGAARDRMQGAIEGPQIQPAEAATSSIKVKTSDQNIQVLTSTVGGMFDSIIEKATTSMAQLRSILGQPIQTAGAKQQGSQGTTEPEGKAGGGMIAPPIGVSTIQHSGALMASGGIITSTSSVQNVQMGDAVAQPASTFADGGMITGAGGPKDDMVPIQASPGEYVVQADAVKHYGVPYMDAINQQTAPGPADTAKSGSQDQTGGKDRSGIYMQPGSNYASTFEKSPGDGGLYIRPGSNYISNSALYAHNQYASTFEKSPGDGGIYMQPGSNYISNSSLYAHDQYVNQGSLYAHNQYAPSQYANQYDSSDSSTYAEGGIIENTSLASGGVVNNDAGVSTVQMGFAEGGLIEGSSHSQSFNALPSMHTDMSNNSDNRAIGGVVAPVTDISSVQSDNRMKSGGMVNNPIDSSLHVSSISLLHKDTITPVGHATGGIVQPATNVSSTRIDNEMQSGGVIDNSTASAINIGPTLAIGGMIGGLHERTSHTRELSDRRSKSSSVSHSKEHMAEGGLVSSSNTISHGEFAIGKDGSNLGDMSKGVPTLPVGAQTFAGDVVHNMMGGSSVMQAIQNFTSGSMFGRMADAALPTESGLSYQGPAKREQSEKLGTVDLRTNFGEFQAQMNRDQLRQMSDKSTHAKLTRGGRRQSWFQG